MNPAPAPHPDVYKGLRENALKQPAAGGGSAGVHLVLMDWVVSNGKVSVLAAEDGTASVYLSNGGGFIGGGQKSSALADAAKRAVHLAASALGRASKTDQFDLPPAGTVYFYIRTAEGVYLAAAEEGSLKAGADPLSRLAATMHGIVAAYRVIHQSRSAAKA